MFIVPPSLQYDVDRFVEHYTASKNYPIMICGPTGVGKSLFLRIFEILFEKGNSINKNIGPVVWANCAHFGGVNSDPNIARSELFGHVKGSHQNAKYSKIGLVHKAHKGALILEEIGELPLEVQAMLLTFIEDGIFRRVGSTDNEHADVRIIGATNREDSLRPDFKQRFFPFYVTPIYRRRRDILYYMYVKDPEIFSSLTGIEVLGLLAYHWPGNCREIERACKIIYRTHLRYKNRSDMEIMNRLNLLWEEFEKQKYPKRLYNVRNDIEKFGGNVCYLDKLLRKSSLSLSREKNAVFSDLPTGKDEIHKFCEPMFDSENSNSKKVFKIKKIKQFERVAKGYILFLRLFGQKGYKNSNFIDDLDSANYDLHIINYLKKIAPREGKELYSLVRAIMMSIKGIYYDGGEYPEDLNEFWNALEEQKKRSDDPNHKEGKRVEIKEGHLDFIENFNEKELLKIYYQKLLKRSNNNIKLAAEMAGHEYSTFRSRLIKIGVPFRKNRSRKE
jgi:transcriptional regulator with AAA-type ATPase domain